MEINITLSFVTQFVGLHFIQESDRIFPPEMPCDVLISVIWTTVSEINLTWKTNHVFGLK